MKTDQSQSRSDALNALLDELLGEASGYDTAGTGQSAQIDKNVAEIRAQIHSFVSERGLWISVKDELPKDYLTGGHPRLLVTNNIDERDAHGHMSHIWLVRMLHERTDGTGFTCFTEYDQRIEDVTHWRYALPNERSERCKAMKMGEYNELRCCREANHEGDHNYVVNHK